eukprot:Seg347.3 transcript_id=Seg347.3/GoldUCD/mRNA.D3Y31 product="Protein-lysine methyltransferase METTL21D" protein_id=Seg347.3/GoldUCD/D3Y31
MSNLFIRELELRDATLEIYQELEGDVGCVVWDAAIALAKYIDGECFRKKEKFHGGKNVLELGAGTGIVGLAAATAGASVTITDLAEFVKLMQMNIDHNAKNTKMGNIKAAELKWGKDLNKFQSHYDYILMADLIYYEQSIMPLVATMNVLSSKETLILMSYEERTTGNKPELQKRFFELAESHFELKKIPLEDQDPVYSSEDIHIYEMRKR